MRLIPPTEGGQPVDISEIMAYLDQRKIGYELRALNNAVKECIEKGEEGIVLINNNTHYPERESYRLIVSDDRMTAIVRFYPPSPGAEEMGIKEFINDLKFEKVICGLQSDEIIEFFSGKVYCTDLKVAVGIPPIQGQEAKITYHFNTDKNAKPTLMEDGSVDFFHLNLVSDCKKGDELATLSPAIPGTMGRNIAGERLHPRNLELLRLQSGRNITISDDGLHIYSDVDGHVELTGGRVFVSDVLEVENVGAGTGNIEYNGSVRILGNVATNYEVKATGDIEVKGVVEGARLEAGGNIIIVRGNNGMGRAELVAGGNVISKFLENTKVSAGNNITSESILHSDVIAKNEINVNGKRGFITGGHVIAGHVITAKTLGSDMGADTVLEVGSDPALKQEFKLLKKKEENLQEEIQVQVPLIDTFKAKMARGANVSKEQMLYIKGVMEKKAELEAELAKAQERLAELEPQIRENKNAHISCTGEVFQGTKIVIGDVSMTAKGGMKYCRFIKEAGDVKMAAL
ncbi:MAG: DUF342 domain-containing protein [Lachnospiraceae bacterium]|nr:DUF342 domain-containing protein [Lachnospiraceae bacterium]